jgi:hypothetical protein
MFLKYVVDECLTCCWGVGKTEGYDGILVVSVSCPKCGLLFFAFFYAYEVVRASKI